jgi:two-component system LytT family response regulator
LKIRALIVDDEPPARLQIRNLLKTHADVEVVGECGNGYEALGAVAEHAPDLMFLDEKMPEINGYDVLERLDKASRPLVIFVTVLKKFALKAFNVEPLHYLLKPVDQERFDEALRRAKERLAAKRRDEGAADYPQYFDIRDAGGRFLVVHIDEVDWIEADEHYVQIHGKRKFPLLRWKISSLAEKLNPHVFVRIHRSYIVKFKLIDEFRYVCKHESWVVMRDGKKLPLSKTGYEKLQSLLGKPS